jgi:hypothetical protein
MVVFAARNLRSMTDVAMACHRLTKILSLRLCKQWGKKGSHHRYRRRN